MKMSVPSKSTVMVNVIAGSMSAECSREFNVPVTKLVWKHTKSTNSERPSRLASTVSPIIKFHCTVTAKGVW